MSLPIEARILALFLGLSLPALPLQPVKYWEDRFLGAWQSELNTYLPSSQGDDSWPYYNLGYAIDGNTAMFTATGNTQYLDRALLYVENAIARARPSSSLPSSQYKDKYLGWISARNDSLETPLYESYCWRYVTRLLLRMQANPQVSAHPGYRKRFDDILAFTEVHMFQKWYTRGLSNLYRVNTHMTCHWAYISLGLSLLPTTSGDPWKQRYAEVCANINRRMPMYGNASLRGQFIPHPQDSSAYFWSAEWGKRALPGQDVSHGNGVVSYLVAAHDAGVEWTREDMMKFVHTLDKRIWPSAGVFAAYVDGSGSGQGWYNDGFCKLGRYDAALQERLEKSTTGRNTQLYGNLAENAWALARSTSLPRSPSARPLRRWEPGRGPVAAVSADGRIFPFALEGSRNRPLPRVRLEGKAAARSQPSSGPVASR